MVRLSDTHIDSKFMKIIANAIRPGNILDHNGKLYAVAKISHTQPGKGGAFIQAEMKNIIDGTKLNERFRSTENVERAILDEKEYQFLYEDGDNITLMDNETFDQVELAKDLAGDAAKFLQDGMMVNVHSHEGQAISIELPETVVLEVAEADAVVKGQTAASSNKPAILENGVRIMVPPFIEAGNKVVVRTADSEYMERYKD